MALRSTIAAIFCHLLACSAIAAGAGNSGASQDRAVTKLESFLQVLKQTGDYDKAYDRCLLTSDQFQNSTPLKFSGTVTLFKPNEMIRRNASASFHYSSPLKDDEVTANAEVRSSFDGETYTYQSAGRDMTDEVQIGIDPRSRKIISFQAKQTRGDNTSEIVCGSLSF